MLEQQLQSVWADHYVIIRFVTNAKAHYGIALGKRSAGIFHKFTKEIEKTYLIISSNLTLALTSDVEYVRAFGELILRNNES